MPLTAQSLNLFNNQALAQAGVSLLPQFAAPYKEGVSYTKRVPNCQKCGQHGRKSRLKGHKRVCPFKDCNCAKCQVVTERQKLMADQIKIRRRQRKDSMMSLTRDNLKTLNAVAAAAAADPLPYINNLNNLNNFNMICKQLSQQQQPATDSKQDLENQCPNGLANLQLPVNPLPTTSLVSLSSLVSMAASQPLHSSSITTTTNSSAFSPHHGSHSDSPHMVSSPMSTIGTEMSLSPQQHPRANSFDLGFLNPINALGSVAPQQQLLSAALSAQPTLQDQVLKSATSTVPTSSAFDMTPPHSAGLAAPIPVNPVLSQAPVTYDQLLALSQILNLQSPVTTQAPAQPLFQPQPLVQPAVPQLNLQDVLSFASLLLQQQQQQQMSPPSEEKPHQSNNNNNFIDVCSV